MTTIYLSSTYEDLTDYRLAVVQALRQSQYHVIAMEDYVATDQRPVDRCLKDIEKPISMSGYLHFDMGMFLLMPTTIRTGCRSPNLSFATPNISRSRF